MKTVCACALLALGLLVDPARAGEPANPFDPATGYRVRAYRAPTPATVPGGKTIDLKELLALKAADAILIDVSPIEGGKRDPATGAVLAAKPRLTIGGAAWLPDAGQGTLEVPREAAIRSALSRLTGGDRNRAVVIFCQADCWMSWNAVKRAAAWGYANLHWYPDGTDGMRDWDVPLVPVLPFTPEPGPLQ